LSRGTCCYIRLYTNAVSDSVMLYFQHDFYNLIFITKHKLYIASGSPHPPPPEEKFCVRTCSLVYSHWSFWIAEQEAGKFFGSSFVAHPGRQHYSDESYTVQRILKSSLHRLSNQTSRHVAQKVVSLRKSSAWKYLAWHIRMSSLMPQATELFKALWMTFL
jgi:hypothetical protein